MTPCATQEQELAYVGELLEQKKQLLLEKHSILKCQSSLHEFVKQAWHILEPKTKFVDGWHIRAICEHLEAVTRGDVRRLIINVPPRTSKSTIVSVMWPAWIWINNPSKRFLCASHSLQSLSLLHSSACKTVVESEWYQRRWGHIVKLSSSQSSKSLFYTTARGYRAITSVTAGGTGLSGDILIGDDLNDTLGVLSDTIRNKTNNWLGTVFLNRLNDRKTGAIVIMMQRCHESDVTGYIVSKDKKGRWTKLILPMEYDSKRPCKTNVVDIKTGKPFEDPRKLDGELLWSNRWGPEELEDWRVTMTPYDVAGQFQQLPAPDEGGIIKGKDFRVWRGKTSPSVSFVVQSWDTALEAKDTSAYSACTTWGIFTDANEVQNIILLNMWRGRVEYPELRALAQRLFKDYRDDGNVNIVPDGKHVPHLVLVESKASGSPLIQDLRKAGILAHGFNPDKYGDKLARVRLITHMIEAGTVWLPARPPEFNELRSFAQIFLDLCKIFPNSDARDVVDTMTQVLLKLLTTNDLKHPKDKEYGNQSTGPRKSPYWPGKDI